MPATFDRSKPFGLVSGDPEGRRYHQGEHFFRADESLWSAPVGTPATADPQTGKTAAKSASKKAASAEPAPAAIDEQLDAQMGDA